MSPMGLIALGEMVLALVAIGVAFRMRHAGKASCVGMAVAAFPPALMLVLFYSLAIHMYRALGGWPASIGTGGFPRGLEMHGNITWEYSSVLLFLSIMVWPILVLLCLAIRPCRAFVRYLAVYAAVFMVCFGSMLLAPSQFLNWWWD